MSFGEVLSDESVGVLVGAALPGMMWGGEVEAGVGDALDVGVAVEFGAVVGRDGAYGSGLALDQLDSPSAELLRGPRVELSDLHISGLSFHEGHDARLAVAEHGVGFPVSDAGAVVGGVGAVLDGSLSRQSSARVVGAVSLPPLLGGLSQVHVQESPVSLVVPDASVDGLVADLESPLESHSPGDLLGAPVLLLQQGLDQVPVLIREAPIAP